jgi:hypothetical protein
VQAAEQARQELQELQDKYEDAQEDLKVAEQQFEQLEHERDIERETAQSKMDAADYYAGLISEIQEKLASSRPGSACDSRNSEAMINTLRQSIGVLLLWPCLGVSADLVCRADGACSHKCSWVLLHAHRYFGSRQDRGPYRMANYSCSMTQCCWVACCNCSEGGNALKTTLEIRHAECPDKVGKAKYSFWNHPWPTYQYVFCTV